MKNYIRKNNIKFTLTEIERLTHTAFTVVTPDRWKSLITHVQQKVENHYWEVDGLTGACGRVHYIYRRGL